MSVSVTAFLCALTHVPRWLGFMAAYYGSSCAGLARRYLWLDLGLVKGLDLELDMLMQAMALEMEEMLMGLAKHLQNQAQDLTLESHNLYH